MNAKTLQRENSFSWGVFLPIGNIVFAFKKVFHPTNMALKLKKKKKKTMKYEKPHKASSNPSSTQARTS